LRQAIKKKHKFRSSGKQQKQHSLARTQRLLRDFLTVSMWSWRKQQHGAALFKLKLAK
jgi:hypothetical protein